MKSNITHLNTLVTNSEIMVTYNGWIVENVEETYFSIDKGDYIANIHYTDKHFDWKNFTVYLRQPNPF